MTSSLKSLSDCIEIKRQFLRSINLEKDHQSKSPSADYIVTPTARQIFHRVAEGLSSGSTYRAWTITGPYGVGKSAFAVFLSKVLCNHGSDSIAARHCLEEADSGLSKEIIRRNGYGKGMLLIAITARRAPVALCLAEGINACLSQIKSSQAKELFSDCEVLLKDVRKGIFADSRRIVTLIASLAKVAQNSGYTGLLFMIDELGKLFEFAARMPQKADVFVLQELAEQASRSGNFPTLFLGFLHQSFEEYGQHLDSITRKEWAKIHGRFEDIAFLEPADQLVRMIASAIKWSDKAFSPALEKNIRNTAKRCAEIGICPAGMRKSEFEEVCLKAYPFHPVALVALPFIFRRFAQNERSLFSYLSSLEPKGFQDFIRSHKMPLDKPEFLRLSHLFEYFTINCGTGLFRQTHARRWLEAADVLDRKEGLTDIHGQLIKTIGVLGALGEFCNLSATGDIVGASLCDASEMTAELKDALRHLQGQSIITYRRFNKTYRIWEGSDVDIDERIAEGQRQLRGSISIASTIQQYLEPRPIVARRYSFECGTLRYFNVCYLDNPMDVPEHLSVAPGAAGHILVCLSSSPKELQDFQENAEETSQNRQNIIFAIPQQVGEIHTAVGELATLRWAWENTPELRDDRVARREVALRITEAEHFIERTIGVLLDPRKEPLGAECLWIWNGKVQPVKTRKEISSLLSLICRELYAKAPWIRNELIARKFLSGAASAARRNLVEKMLNSAASTNLSINGFPPERSIYESVLKATGLHTEEHNEKWIFVDPSEGKHHGLAPAWKHLSKIIFESDGEPISLDMVFRMMAEPPYGIIDGLQPILLCAFMLAHPDETTLYREGTFIPEPSIADFELLMRRPELYAIGGIRIAGARASIVERLARSLKTRSATVPVVRTMFKMVKGLPEFAWRTKKLKINTINMREAFQKAKAPEKFLYSELPQALGLDAFPDSRPDKTEIETFFAALNESLKEWSSIFTSVSVEAKGHLLKACGLEPNNDGWQRLREIAAKLEPRETDPVVLQFLRRVIQANQDKEGISSVLAIVANRPPTNWLDTDVDRFPELAKVLGDPIKRSIARAGLRSESQEIMATLSSEQRNSAMSLVNEFKKKLNISFHRGSPEITRAALLLLADELSKNTGAKK